MNLIKNQEQSKSKSKNKYKFFLSAKHYQKAKTINYNYKKQKPSDASFAIIVYECAEILLLNNDDWRRNSKIIPLVAKMIGFEIQDRKLIIPKNKYIRPEYRNLTLESFVNKVHHSLKRLMKQNILITLKHQEHNGIYAKDFEIVTTNSKVKKGLSLTLSPKPLPSIVPPLNREYTQKPNAEYANEYYYNDNLRKINRIKHKKIFEIQGRTQEYIDNLNKIVVEYGSYRNKHITKGSKKEYSKKRDVVWFYVNRDGKNYIGGNKKLVEIYKEILRLRRTITYKAPVITSEATLESIKYLVEEFTVKLQSMSRNCSMTFVDNEKLRQIKEAEMRYDWTVIMGKDMENYFLCKKSLYTKQELIDFIKLKNL